jgi:hypothetical protein
VELFGASPIHTNVCPKCVRGEMVFGVQLTPAPKEVAMYAPWCSAVACPRCSVKWFVCKTCVDIRNILDTARKVQNHSRRYHKKAVVPDSLPRTDSNLTAKVSSSNQVGTSNSTAKVSSTNQVGTSTEQKRSNRPRQFKKKDREFSVSRTNLNRSEKEHYHHNPGNPLVDETVIEETPSREFGGIPTAVSDCAFNRDESRDYFGNNYHRRNGVAYLLSRSFYNNQCSPENIDDEDLKICMSLTLLVKTLTVNQADMLGEFLSLLTGRLGKMERQWERHEDELKRNLEKANTNQYCRKCTCHSCKSQQHGKRMVSSKKFRPLRLPPIPKDALEIRSKIRDGRNAFLNLLPHPKICTTEDGHVFVLPSDCILHFLSHGNEPMEFNILEQNYPVFSVNQTPRGVEIARDLDRVTNGKFLSKRHFNISFLEWKDDLESAKSNRASKSALWLFTITIFKKERGLDSSIATFPVGLGPKGINHDTVEKAIGDDIMRLRTSALNGIFGRTNTNEPYPCTFSADLYMSLGDQPERRGGNVLQMGTSRNHARWRHVCDYGKLFDVLPACPTCYQKMLQSDSLEARKDPTFDKTSWRTYNCNICTNWGKDMSSEMMRFEKTEKYPDGYMLGGTPGNVQTHKPIVLTHEILEEVMDLTFINVSNGNWTKVQGVAFLTEHCINVKYAKIATNRAWNLRVFNEVRDDPSEEKYFRRLFKDRTDNPKKYEQLRIPALYKRGVPLDRFGDTPMHLLLLGVARTVFRRITIWSTRRGRKHAFLALAKND